MSNLDSIDVSFMCDREMIEDPWELVDGLRVSLDELIASDGHKRPSG